MVTSEEAVEVGFEPKQSGPTLITAIANGQ
jgi:hypothetical protein